MPGLQVPCKRSVTFASGRTDHLREVVDRLEDQDRCDGTANKNVNQLGTVHRAPILTRRPSLRKLPALTGVSRSVASLLFASFSAYASGRSIATD